MELKDSPSKLKLAVVILNYNGLEHLRTFLQSVVECLPDYAELIIADNASTDESVPFIKQYFPNIRLILLSENTGYAGGYNAALSQIDAEYYFLLNSDVELTPDSIDPLIQFLDKNKSYAACQPKVLALREKENFEYAGAAGGWIDRFGYPFCRGRILDTTEKDEGQYDQYEPIFWASGAALMIRSKDFHECGRLDEDFFAHMEEIDLCWRIQKMNKKISIVPDSIIYHLGGGTLEYAHPTKTYLNFRNSLYVLLKNENHPFLIIFIRLILDGVAGVRFLLMRDWGNFKAIPKAHFHFYKNIPRMWKKRKAFEEQLDQNNIPKKKNLCGRYQGSIVWDYYILNRKKFSALDVNKKKQTQIQNHI